MTYDETQFLRPVPGFPDYSVSRSGRFYNNQNGNELTLTPVQSGELTVGLMREGIQYRRSARLLLAQAWLPGRGENDSTPIFLDGDHNHLSVDNLAWRPRWFAWKYQRQLTDPPHYADWGPLLELTHNQKYHSVKEAALATGSLMSDIVGSISNEAYVFPGRHKFVYLDRR